MDVFRSPGGSGDTGAARIYKRKMVLTVIVTGALLLVSGSVLSVSGQHRAILITSVVAVFVCVPLALEFRRAITISAQTFEYKWRSGEVVRINVADIEAMEEVTTPYMMFLGRPVFVPGLRVVLKSGEVHNFPLDFPDRVEIVARLQKMISSTTPET
jgi:hypothetical protein